MASVKCRIVVTSVHTVTVESTDSDTWESVIDKAEDLFYSGNTELTSENVNSDIDSVDGILKGFNEEEPKDVY